MVVSSPLQGGRRHGGAVHTVTHGGVGRLGRHARVGWGNWGQKKKKILYYSSNIRTK